MNLDWNCEGFTKNWPVTFYAAAFFCIFAFAFVGCTTPRLGPSKYAVRAMSKQEEITFYRMDELRKVPIKTLCFDYFYLGRDGLLASNALTQLEEVLLEKGMTESDLEVARRNEISIGMSTWGLYASWGVPTAWRWAITDRGEIIEHIYGLSIIGLSRPTFVYSENGKVVGWGEGE